MKCLKLFWNDFIRAATILGYQIERMSGSVIYKNNYCWNSVLPFCFISFFVYTRKYKLDKTKYVKTLLHWTELRRYKIAGCIEKASRKIWGNNNARYRKKVVEMRERDAGATSICTFSNKVWSWSRAKAEWRVVSLAEITRVVPTTQED